VEVQVGIDTEGPPTHPRLDVVCRAAAQFTDDTSSIRVTHKPMPDRHCLIVQFTMRTIAQYKIVDDIAARFKMDIWDFDDYMDMWIAFPKCHTKPRRRGRKSKTDPASGS
jgi:hypothetical protein